MSITAPWVRTRGLDAETLLEVVTLFDMDLWTKTAEKEELSCTALHEFLFTACSSFQEIHAQTDWSDHGDFWGAVESYMRAVNAAAAKDEDWISWKVEDFKRVLPAPLCEGCDGSGVRPWANQSADMKNCAPHAGPPPEGHVIVERCDTCNTYPDDLEAAKAWGDDAQWQKGNGTAQAIARPRATT
jgi:hypothetical protein